jgi:protein-tyrosine phosphatase
MAVATATATANRRPWIASLSWLAALGAFFFLSYNTSNWIASQRSHVPTVMFNWEKSTPFLAWTIVPYWTSDLLYVLSILICKTRKELDMHAKRLLGVQLISVAVFVAMPLLCGFERPATHGFFGWLFTVLLGFDRPFNQAPSLHVSLAVILWDRFAAHLSGFWKNAMTAWLALVVISTMTTYQHQFVDLPTGALAGLLAIALFPDEEWKSRRAQRFRMATFYLAGATLLDAIPFRFGGYSWLLLWPGTALALVSIAYAADMPGLLRLLPARLVLVPYTMAAWLNSRWWTRSHAPVEEIVPGVWLGRAPAWFDGGSGDFRSVVNLSAELHVSHDGARNIPMLDLVDPTTDQIREAVAAIEELGEERPTLVCCALGYSRSASAVAAWLTATGHVRSREEAVARIRERRPQIVLPAWQEAEVAGRF